MPLTSLIIILLAGPIRAVYGQARDIGCFTDIGAILDMGPAVFQSHGLCQQRCRSRSLNIFGLTNNTYCLCGNDLPPMWSRVEEILCDSPCPGYPVDSCGGPGFVSVGVMDPDVQRSQLSTTTDIAQTGLEGMPTVVPAGNHELGSCFGQKCG